MDGGNFLRVKYNRYQFIGNPIFLFVLIFCFSAMILGVLPALIQAQNVASTNSNNPKSTPAIPSKVDENRFIVEVKATDYAFMAPQKIPSGWISFVLNNSEAQKIHELSIGRLPEGITYSEYLDEYVGAWEKVLKEFQDGDIKASGIHERVAQLLPEWSDQVTYLGSRGLVSPGRSAQKTVYLEPGRYTLDCWAKTSDGLIHVSRGMSRPITVSDESAETQEPDPANRIILHKDKIEADWQPSLGDHLFALMFIKDKNGRPMHSNIHLIKIDGKTDLDRVNRWLNWYRIGGLRTPAPAEFLGGVSSYYAEPGKGSTYFSVHIENPGTYTWIVHAENQRLWKTFTIEK